MNTKEVQYKIPILTYHSIDNSSSVISTSPEKFRNQMQYLYDSSFNVVSLEKIISCIRENRNFPPRPVAITIDFGVHTLNHPHLPRLTLKEAEYEIVESRRVLEKYLHKDVLLFDYP